ncbi:methylated-DNA--[protein]-cysteine S-methyltransferase [Spongiibacter taiwanensis]|uniref:bifunctional transcriptional activator/DNA repair enzyme AdaA n=1 Tax=Spongiibacter taiwanensis TaxID=1748242 RepID=UPI002035F54B|nr:methylated-DNA--[protein]-cysteine S-methyltransferase [Spongiibacter taiwanensis]USA41707.1 methylated-DNA--[protein]-cysteine S-methyltransferase [Spongiibacter taiwanensis]
MSKASTPQSTIPLSTLSARAGHGQTNYQRIALAIDFLQHHFTRQPSLDEVAAAVHLSPFHFQRLFTEWAGVSPKKFIQYLSLNYAKGLLQEPRSLMETAHSAGLSGSGRLHDLFVKIEGMTPGEYRQGGEGLTIRHSVADSPFGQVLVASTDKGVCHLAFEDETTKALAELQHRFPKASYVAGQDAHQRAALTIFRPAGETGGTQPVPLSTIKLHLQGTPFQLKVWESLLRIPEGQLRSYGHLAHALGQPKASRAVGTAIGSNPVAFLIPCHRVIQASGKLGGYRWGPTRKSALIAWEAARLHGRAAEAGGE